MNIDRSATRLGLGIGGGRMLVTFVFSLVLHSRLSFLSQETVLPLFDTWFDVVNAVATTITYIAPALIAIGAFYLVTNDEKTVNSVILGAVLGGVLYGPGYTVLTSVAFGYPVHTFFVFLRIGAMLGIIFVGTASLGALGGDLVGPRLARASRTPR